ncbi:MAG: hypothetical protein RLZZ28_596 [Bacteroidota bacterium]|jgi:catechol 2,3-dioxygenase-like lactoylglutathione lyase family enzyme
MEFERLTPMLWTNDVKASIDFYTKLLGFTLDEYNEEWEWCHLHKGPVNLMFAKPNEHSAYEGAPNFTGSFYFYVTALDALWAELSARVTISYPIANFSHHMREFAILDNNGYLLQFGRELKEGEMIDEA